MSRPATIELRVELGRVPASSLDPGALAVGAVLDAPPGLELRDGALFHEVDAFVASGGELLGAGHPGAIRAILGVCELGRYELVRIPEPAREPADAAGMLVFELGRARVPAEELATLADFECLPLPWEPGDPADLALEGRKLATGRFVPVAGGLGFRVEALAS